MRADFDTVRARFRDEASVIHVRVMETFELNTKKLNRQRDENVFQQLTARYADELKRELSRMAEQLIDHYGDDTSRYLLRQDFTHQIAYYISEWHLKIRSM